mgnify:CR=1 FL=1
MEIAVDIFQVRRLSNAKRDSGVYLGGRELGEEYYSVEVAKDRAAGQGV